MSVSNPELDPDSQLSEKASKLAEYLIQAVTENNGVMYTKGKFIKDDVGLTPKEIGQLMTQLEEECVTLDVEPWSYTGATTWRIELQQPRVTQQKPMQQLAD